MSEHRVGSLDIHLRTHGAPPAEVASEARGFAERLVEEIANRLEERTGGKLVFVRHLPLKLRAGRDLFGDRAELERIAADVAASITWDDEVPPGQQDVAVFEDETAWRAAYIVELARGSGSGWCFEALAREPDGLGGLTQLAAAQVLDVLAQVQPYSALATLLSRARPDALLTLARVLEIERLSSAVGSAVVPDDAVREIRERVVTLVAAHSAQPHAVPPARARTESDRAAPSSDVDDVSQGALHTRFAGLVYIVRCWLELDTGEVLWRACVPEQLVLAAALSSFSDDAHDPAPEQLGGALPSLRLEISAAQREEIVAASCASLVAALPRRGLAKIPPLELSFIDGPHGRVLCACVGVAVVFAVPTASPSDVRTAIDGLQRVWQGIPMQGAAAIAELAPDRIRVVSTGPSPKLRADLPRDVALTVAVIAGCAAALFQARAGHLALAVRGRIHDEGNARIVTMPMEAIDLDVRRAGLDRDPGWIPWLERHVRIVFD